MIEKGTEDTMLLKDWSTVLYEGIINFYESIKSKFLRGSGTM